MSIQCKSLKDLPQAIDALHAVIELHKPVMTMFGLPVCSICRGPALQHGMERNPEIYPCKTIQIIGEELSEWVMLK